MAIKKYELDLLSLPPRVPDQVSAAKEQPRATLTTNYLTDTADLLRKRRSRP